MKRILLMSDTHGHIDSTMIAHAKEADEVWHAGDIGGLSVTDEIQKYTPVRAVFGNIDDLSIRKTFPEDNRFLCENVDVLITHIGGYPNHYNAKVKAILKSAPPKLFICGHSHILKVMWDKTYNLLHINPGAAGRHGFHKIRTMVRFVIDNENITKLDLIELGNR